MPTSPSVAANARVAELRGRGVDIVNFTVGEPDMGTAPHILDAVNAGLIVLDREQRILHWNAWMVSASGYRAADVYGKPLTTVFPGIDVSRLTTAIAAVKT